MVSILSMFPNDILVLSIPTLFLFLFSWEYPAKAGIGCNTMNKDDTANFLSFLQELRQHPLGSKLILSAATTILPFTGSDGKPLSDVSGFAKVLDYIEIMNYDIWGPWSPTVGPNTPLNDICAATQNQAGSAVSAVQKWHAAGFALDQLVLGVASYGHSFSVNKTDAFEAGSTTLASYQRFNASAHPKGDSWDGGAGVDECGNAVFPGGTIDFWGLIQLGYLDPDGTPKKGIFFRYDNCSQTVSFFFVLLDQVFTGSGLAICL
jgi:chitinase